MNIRPLSPAVSNYVRPGISQNNENPSFGYLRTPLSADVVKLIKKKREFNPNIDAVIGAVTKAQKENSWFHIHPEVTVWENVRTLALHIIKPGERQPIHTVFAKAPDQSGNITNAFNEASEFATARAVVAKKAKEEAERAAQDTVAKAAESKVENHNPKGRRDRKQFQASA